MKCNRIYIIDDDESDATFLSQAALKKGLDIEFAHISDAARAENEILSRGMGVVLLDLKMPKEDGISVLKRLKKNDNFRKYPVIVFSSSNNPDDVTACYENGANAYTVKPSTLADYEQFIEKFASFWMGCAVLDV